MSVCTRWQLARLAKAHTHKSPQSQNTFIHVKEQDVTSDYERETQGEKGICASVRAWCLFNLPVGSLITHVENTHGLSNLRSMFWFCFLHHSGASGIKEQGWEGEMRRKSRRRRRMKIISLCFSLVNLPSCCQRLCSWCACFLKVMRADLLVGYCMFGHRCTCAQCFLLCAAGTVGGTGVGYPCTSGANGKGGFGHNLNELNTFCMLTSSLLGLIVV